MVDAALELFAADGYANVSTRRIADRAGCSETLLFRYFGGKRGLLVAITDNYIDAHRGSGSAVAGQAGLIEFIESHILGICESMQSRARETRVLMGQLTNEPGLSQEFEKRHEAAITGLQRELTRYRELGEVAPEVDVRAVAVGIEGLAFSLAFVEEIIYLRGREHSARVAHSFATLLADSMRPRPVVPGALSETARDRGAAAVREAIAMLQGALPLLTTADREAASMTEGG